MTAARYDDRFKRDAVRIFRALRPTMSVTRLAAMLHVDAKTLRLWIAERSAGLRSHEDLIAPQPAASRPGERRAFQVALTVSMTSRHRP